ncbi:hypothetical protein G6K83_07830 [Agrobacterium rhizogenes]|uniref:hypothetical protein n=1 Tax=Rhizobium rhizogenes TaxID=359 RepID=UPI0015724A25|nr:hypothetical protein [Rhizobium rhizogenes]NTH24982.1 hypothetical protein [Rhizobium rhizogenes]
MMGYNERFRYITDDKHFEKYGLAVTWAHSGRDPAAATTDRLQAQYLRRSPSDGALQAHDSLAVSGMQALSLRDAATLGFSTSEYHAGLRAQMLQWRILQNEEELAAECLPPLTFIEADDREQGMDTSDSWVAQSPSQRVPYPNERMLSRVKAIGWATDDGRLLRGAPSDRFGTRWLMRDTATKQLHLSSGTMADEGIESLSITDALRLGFSTVEYRTALRVRLFERRHLSDETDLQESICPPYDVRESFEQWGRIFVEDEDRQLTRDLYGPTGFDFGHNEEAARTWMDRRRIIERPPFLHP